MSDDYEDDLRRKREFFEFFDFVHGGDGDGDSDENPEHWRLPARETEPTDGPHRGVCGKGLLSVEEPLEQDHSGNDCHLGAQQAVAETSTIKIPATVPAQKEAVKSIPPPRQVDDEGRARKSYPGDASRPYALSSSTTTGKRKRSDKETRVPERRQVFKDLTFFFVPNDEISPARTMRIRKAIEYGAEWARRWSDAVTHVVVDSGIPIKDVLRYLRMDKFPSHVVLVYERYPADCLTFGMLINPDQALYRVKNADNGVRDAKLAKPASKNDSDKSLELKAERRPGYVIEPDTPSREYDDTMEASTEEHSPSKTKLTEPTTEGELAATRSENETAFEQALAETRLVQHLPLDSDEDDAQSRPSSSDSRMSSEPDRRPSIGKPSWQSSFRCMQPPSDPTNHTNSNPNSGTIAILDQIHKYYETHKDQWRTLAYRKAIATLRRTTTLIATEEAAAALPGIGPRISSKIAEIAATGRLRRLESAQNGEPADKALALFLGIYGVGLAQASKWAFGAGYRSLEELESKAGAELTPSQRIGIAHYEDFKRRIPREEVSRHGDIVRKALHEIDPSYEAIVTGSYRRGAPSCGDIDIIIQKPGCDDMTHLRSQVFGQVVPTLWTQGFLVAELATGFSHSHSHSLRRSNPHTKDSENSGSSKWHGACVLPSPFPKTPNLDPPKNPWRRLDLLLVPHTERAAALLYFTGDDIFNRSMRLLARKRGMCLNQRGLYADTIRRGTEKTAQGRKVAGGGGGERGIFEMLGVQWREPWERRCA
ncbi:MAG: hypothetical protein M1828_002749 [Chrysothrix sp. TS-e1954]|nr:MAG: hypothetical protein M1828_002749 [Chrysothrix sp. TS-e1954]